MTGFARLIVVIFICSRLAFSMENRGNYKKIKKKDDTYLTADNLDEEAFNYKNEFFDQKLDHINQANSKTWKQKYILVDDFYKRVRKSKKISPVLLMLGGQERIEMEDLVDKVWISWCIDLKALCLAPEHRFYGDSQPTNDTSDANLKKYLNIDQAVADYLYFIEGMKIKLELPDQTKWIVFGCDYAGTLAAIMKFKKPELVHGVVAYSAYFPKNFFLPEYYKRMGDMFTKPNSKLGQECFSSIRRAFSSLKHKIEEGSTRTCENIRDTFKLNNNFNCAERPHVSLLFEQLSSKIASKVKDKKKMESLCKSFPKSPNENKIIEKLASGLKKLYPEDEDSLAITADYQGRIDELRETNWNEKTDERIRYYQKCTELGGFPVPANVLSNDVTVEFLFKFYCTETFELDYNSIKKGTNYNSIEETKRVKFYNFNDLRKEFYDNTVFIVGKSDLFYDAQMAVDNPSENNVIEVQKASNCYDLTILYASKYSTTTEDNVYKIIKKWI